nr:DUF2142 domain-containing protein [Saccharopolyspora sp. HNM0983]
MLSALFGCIFLVMNPPLWGSDEFAHFGRAYAIDHGQIVPREMPDPNGTNFGGEIPTTVNALREYAAEAVATLPEPPEPRVADPGAYAELAAQPLQAPHIEMGFVNTSSYSPIAYLPSVLGLRAAELVGASVGAALATMRLCTLIASTSLVWLGLRALSEHRFKWAVLVVALLPMTVFQASMITADAVTNALALLFSCLFAKAAFLRARLSTWESWTLCATAVALPLAKPTYVILALLLAITPAAQLSLRTPVKYLATVVGAAAFLAWTAVSAKTSAGMHLMRPGVHVSQDDQLQLVLADPIRFVGVLVNTFVQLEPDIVTGMFGTLGNTAVPIPATAVAMCLVAAVVAVGFSEPACADRPRLLVTSAGLVLSVAAIFGALYLEWTAVGHFTIDGVQGRYFLPLAVLALAVYAQLVPLRWQAAPPRSSAVPEKVVVVMVTTALALAALKYWYVLWG